MPRYDEPEAGEWIQPKRQGYKMACCDCGLVHSMNFRLVESANGGKTIQFQVFRDNRATGQVRRHAKVITVLDRSPVGKRKRSKHGR